MLNILDLVRHEQSRDRMNAIRMALPVSDVPTLRFLSRAVYALDRWLWPHRVRFAIAAEAKQAAYIASLPECNDEALVLDLTNRLRLSSGMVEAS